MQLNFIVFLNRQKFIFSNKLWLVGYICSKSNYVVQAIKTTAQQNVVVKAECLTSPWQWRPSIGCMVQNKIGGCKDEFEANEYSKWLGLVWVWWDVAENLLNLKSNNPTDTFGISKRTRGTWRGMQEGNFNKKGHKSFFFALHLCHVFLNGEITRQPKRM